ncbi:MAG: FKBP-type peptidyl-prolyl cis-trans isomerase [Betaproteobacteria bacterium]|nr:FKBP-type peptidyl-prolyl cis-trans isomerase [Betaproteobacteria bacterium]MCC6250227.1 FKBP-type peptidyl-prolyl cis-trans isomerase [Rubrivivax sp.]MCL4696192.1 FKBP-type peptidyl-prolyl cis-trans isomerase [Burkholderiaceae bacterium]
MKPTHLRFAAVFSAPLIALCLAGTAAAQTASPPAGPLAAAAAEKGAVVTASGLVYRALEEGKGASPAATDTVRVHYRGRFPDGREFDSSHSRGQPASFPLNRVIRCWTEGVQRMKVGGKAKLTCPAAIAYGERGAGGVIPPNAILQFEVELLGITKAN